jgi:hypothetical protein
MATRRFLSWAAAPAVLALCNAAIAAPAPGDYLSFVACPIARDTGPSTDLCFLTEFEGVRYGLANPTDWGNPQLRHRVLVEGRVGRGPPVCGGVAFDGRASVLTELAPECDTVLPFDGSVIGVAGGIFNSGPPEQRARMAELAKSAEANPELSVRPIMPDPPPDMLPTAPYTVRTLDIVYPFDSDRGSGPDMLALTRLVAYARASKGRFEIESRQGVSRLSDGQSLAETAGLAKQRADKMVGILTGLGIPAADISVRINAAAPGDPAGENWKDRRIGLTVRPR